MASFFFRNEWPKSSALYESYSSLNCQRTDFRIKLVDYQNGWVNSFVQAGVAEAFVRLVLDFRLGLNLRSGQELHRRPRARRNHPASR